MVMFKRYQVDFPSFENPAMWGKIAVIHLSISFHCSISTGKSPFGFLFMLKSSSCGPPVGPGLGFSNFITHNFVQEINERDAQGMSEVDLVMNCQNTLLAVKMSPSSQSDLDGNIKVHPDAITRSQPPPQKLYSDDIPVL